ncbi:MAG: NAD(P)/FAD-dependent oxidoreductase [Candidatus Latescibacteria bacterium]|nr:NAD(P)/FAD-dependent oxidoreductase [Candidatus Latescibacterota bacterium]
MLKDRQFDTIIIGAGAAGMIAGISAAQAKPKQNIAIIEKNWILGKKVLVTGNGRCNLTNVNLSPDKYYGENTKCLHNIFNRFSADDTIKFFNKLDVKLKTENDGRVFPITDMSSTIVDALSKELSQQKVKIYVNERLVKLIPDQDGWQVKTDKNIYETKSVIIATGGKSYPESGSTGDGYDIARQFGHRIIEPRPALVSLELKSDLFKELPGVKANVTITLTAQRKVVKRSTGEILFTHFGISGPIVLDLSRLINNNSEVSVNFMPELRKHEELNDLFRQYPRKTFVNTLDTILPKKLCQVLLNELKIDTEKQASHLTKNENQLIFDKLTNWQLPIRGSRSFEESMVTAGGVSMDEINHRTMESLKAKGLYFAGEILDIDGVSGGYNLQFAWSTGFIAGSSV